MRRLVFALCLLASVYTFHVRQPDYTIVVKDVEIVNHPNAKIQLDELIPLAELLKKHDPRPAPSPRLTSATLNEWGDRIFADIQTAITQNGLDPMQLPDIHQTFVVTIVVDFEGHVNLVNGWLSDVSTIHRGADLIVTYDPEARFLELILPIYFNDLIFTFDYSADIMGLGPAGQVDGSVIDLQLEARLGFYVDEIHLNLDSFEIVHGGSIELNFSGDALVDWLLNALSDVLMTLLHDLVLNLIEGLVRDSLVTLVDTINQAIDSTLNPTTPGPTSTVATVFRYIN